MALQHVLVMCLGVAMTLHAASGYCTMGNIKNSDELKKLNIFQIPVTLKDKFVKPNSIRCLDGYPKNPDWSQLEGKLKCIVENKFERKIEKNGKIANDLFCGVAKTSTCTLRKSDRSLREKYKISYLPGSHRGKSPSYFLCKAGYEQTKQSRKTSITCTENGYSMGNLPSRHFCSKTTTCPAGNIGDVQITASVTKGLNPSFECLNGKTKISSLYSVTQTDNTAFPLKCQHGKIMAVESMHVHTVQDVCVEPWCHQITQPTAKIATTYALSKANIVCNNPSTHEVVPGVEAKCLNNGNFSLTKSGQKYNGDLCEPIQTNRSCEYQGKTIDHDTVIEQSSGHCDYGLKLNKKVGNQGHGTSSLIRTGYVTTRCNNGQVVTDKSCIQKKFCTQRGGPSKFLLGQIASFPCPGNRGHHSHQCIINNQWSRLGWWCSKECRVDGRTVENGANSTNACGDVWTCQDGVAVNHTPCLQSAWKVLSNGRWNMEEVTPMKA